MKKGKYLAPRRSRRPNLLLWGAVALVLVGVVAAGAWFLWPDDPALESTGEPADQPPVPSGGEAQTEATAGTGEDQTGSSARQQAQQILDTMTTEEKVYQLFIVTQEQITGVGVAVQSGETTRQAIEKYPVGGIIYFSHNLESREQTTSMIQGIQSYAKLGLFIAVDEEGGPVVRIADNSAMDTTWFPAMGTIGETGDITQAYQVGFTIGTEIGELGFNLDFAPVADVYSNPVNTVIGNRAFSSDPEACADMVAACVGGFNDSGMLCTLKHFPGHGDTGEDSHYGAAEAGKTLEEMRQCEFVPFQAGIDAGAPFVMIGHITAPNVTEEDVPATLSYEIVTGLLRNELGFEGLVITDAMNMGAITNHYSSGEAAVMALQAGVDIILMPSDLTGAVQGIMDALESGQLTQEQIDEKILRILECKIEAGIIQPQ